MKKYLIATLFLITASTAKSQSNNADSIYNTVEIRASYPGGLQQLYQYLGHNIKYPAAAREANKQGVVFFTFVVEKDGSISGLKLVRGVSADIDAEAMRVLATMANWLPAEQHGEAVRSRYTLPITFSLNKSPLTKTPNDVYAAVEHAPSYPGGITEFYKFLSSNIVYPQSARKANIQGKVFLTFIIEKDGAVSNVKVVRGVSAAIDSEAVRVMRTSPNWMPGKQNNVPVRCQYTVPISFNLTKN